MPDLYSLCKINHCAKADCAVPTVNNPTITWPMAEHARESRDKGLAEGHSTFSFELLSDME